MDSQRKTEGSDEPVVGVLLVEYPSIFALNPPAGSGGAGSLATDDTPPLGSPPSLPHADGDTASMPDIVRERYTVVDGATLRIGRARQNDIVVCDRDISRFHATFNASSNGIVLSDLSSTNGTFVNGRRITTPVDLMPGDTITIGNARITVNLAQSVSQEEEDTRTKLAELQNEEVTVLLVDVVSYTKMSQDLPPDDVANGLRAWFEVVAPIIHEQGGEIDKYIGDCVMALWRGTRSNAARLAVMAITAAEKITEATKALGASGEWPHEATYPWRCRAALNTGTALVGTVGASGRRNYTVLGDAINVAFRIESLAGKLKREIVMSQTTAELAGTSFPLERVGEFDLEGRSGMIAVYTVAG